MAGHTVSEFLDTAIEIYGRLSNYRKGLDTVLPKHFQLSPENELDLIELIIKLSSTIVRTDCHELKEFFSSLKKFLFRLYKLSQRQLRVIELLDWRLGQTQYPSRKEQTLPLGLSHRLKRKTKRKKEKWLKHSKKCFLQQTNSNFFSHVKKSFKRSIGARRQQTSS